MALKENTTYRGYASAIKPFIQTAKDVGESLPVNKPTEKFSGLVDIIKQQPMQSGSAMPRQSVPTSLSSIGSVTTPYGGSTRYEKFHPGVDIANKIGTSIPTFTEGVVTDVRIGQGSNSAKSSYGNYVIVTDPQGNKHRYSHLDKVFVAINEPVTAGSEIGRMGVSGSVYSLSGGTGSHLDYRVMNAFNKYINPLQFIK